jgi:hypothetical protein
VTHYYEKCILNCIIEPAGKTPFGRPKHRWRRLKSVFMEYGLRGVDWIYLAQDIN